MPTACSPRNYASCTSMIGGRLRSVQIPAEGSDSHPFATCVCPIPVSVFHFPFFSLYGPTSFHQKSCHISPFSPAPPSVSRHTFLHFSSPLHRPFVLLHRCLSYPPCTLSFFHIIMYAHVCGCGSAHQNEYNFYYHNSFGRNTPSPYMMYADFYPSNNGDTY